MNPFPIYDLAPVPEGFAILRNDTALSTPAGASFLVPTEALAHALLVEWRGQGAKLKPEAMPLTQLAATALDIISKKQADIVDSLAAYVGSDLLCHRADEPPELAVRQAKLWQPWLDWAANTYGASLATGAGVMPIPQPAAALSLLHQVIAANDPFHLAGLQQAVGVTGSLILGLALADGQASVDQVFAAAELDSLFQIEKWGSDPVTAERHRGVCAELRLCRTWFDLLSG